MASEGSTDESGKNNERDNANGGIMITIASISNYSGIETIGYVRLNKITLISGENNVDKTRFFYALTSKIVNYYDRVGDKLKITSPKKISYDEVWNVGAETLFRHDPYFKAKRIIENGKGNELMPMIQLFEPRTKRLFIEDEVITIEYDNGGKAEVHYKTSEATLSWMERVAMIIADEIKVILIENIETGIHRSIIERFWEYIVDLLKKRDCQIIATTQSLEMIEGLWEAAENSSFFDVGYIRFSRKDDVVTPYHFNFDELKFALDRNFEVR